MTKLIPNPIKKAFFDILYNNIPIDNTPVEVLIEYPPLDTTDCITMELSGGIMGDVRVAGAELHPLPPDHKYYDPKHPDELYNTKVFVSETVHAVLNIHIWSNTGEKNSTIVHGIKKCINMALNHHYSYCTNFDNQNICSTTGKLCDAIKIKNHLSIRGICPYSEVRDKNDPNYRGPDNVFNQNLIIPDSCKIRPEQNVDDLGASPPVYHTVIPLDLVYEDKTVNDIHPVCGLEFRGGILK